MANHDQEELLNILQVQGQQFLDSFSIPDFSRKKRKRTEDRSKGKRKVIKISRDDHDSDSDEERRIASNSKDIEDLEEAPFEQEDDEFTADTSSRTASVVVFTDPQSKNTAPLSTTKSQKKAFMSSKTSKLTQDAEDVGGDELDEKVDSEHTNTQNDALLHRLVHTKLLSGSLNPELDLTPAQRKKALAGRVLEAAGGVKLGKGERAVRETERNRAAKRVREGLLDKKREREKKELEDAKSLGNYHPTIKKLFEPSTSNSSDNRKRERGMKMGVGKFSGGMLRLSRDEISAVQASGARERGSRGRGMGRGRGRGSAR